MKLCVSLLLLFPFLGAFFLAVVGRYLPRRVVESLACTCVLASLMLTVTAFFIAGDKSHTITLVNWIVLADFSAPMSVFYNPLAATMALMVTLVSSLIHLYSVSFMRDEEDYVRYFCYLNLFVCAMLVIILADNLIFLYLGWEGVGFCSYALIGFWYRDGVKATAGRKAFVLTRIGDLAFTIAIGFFFVIFHTFSITSITAHVASLNMSMATVLGILLLWAAVGKSAQLPLAVWLPDAMAGPTPVSALIHAATMVTAGVYLLMRFFPVITVSPTAMMIIAFVGAVTAFYGACSALVQKDIKRILAYSTISQVSYMFLGVGAGDILGGFFLLLSHAFFKALLFLTAGCIIQAFHDEHDIFRMGNVRRHLPVVHWLFLIGALSLSGFPPFGGYFSKSRILLATLNHEGTIYTVLWLIAMGAAVLTPLYIFRLFFIAFPDRPEGRKEEEIAAIPKSMQMILWPLALLSLLDGLRNFPGWPGKQWLIHYLSGIPGSVGEINVLPAVAWAMGVWETSLSLAMVLLAYFLFYRPTQKALWMGFHEFLVSGFYLDRLYHFIMVRPYQAMAKFLWVNVDEGILDQGIDKTGNLVQGFSLGLRMWTSGKLSLYLRMLLLGFTAILGALAFGWYLR